ncbi:MULTISPECIES: peptidase [Pseudescherichia]|uniref:peptidase n=1 Tax=Pseudescherichia TaxID=2055880 RepID=UPI003F57F130
MGNALFRKLIQSVLMSEAPAPEDSGGGGDAPAPVADPSAPAGNEPPAADPAKPVADPEKPEGDKPDDQKKQEEQKPEGAPEKYEFKPAEGQQLDAAALEQFEPIARELNLTNEQAQKMVDLYGSQILPMVQKQQAEAWQQTTEQWAADVKADKEIGGDKLTSNISVAQRALDTFGTPELKEYLTASGLGNHPELVKAFVKIGKAMSEDGMVTGKEAGQRSAAEVLYGK